MAKAEYGPNFLEWWKHYPRKTAKPQAWAAWLKQDVEGDLFLAKAATADLEKRTRLKWWSSNPKKIPHPASWINARRWEDEGWEDECGHDDNHQPVKTDYQKPEEPERKVPWHEVVLNRLGRNYILASGGLPDTDRLQEVKRDTISTVVPAFQEDIDNEATTLNQAALDIGRYFLRNLDRVYDLTLGDTVYRKSLARP